MGDVIIVSTQGRSLLTMAEARELLAAIFDPERVDVRRIVAPGRSDEFVINVRPAEGEELRVTGLPGGALVVDREPHRAAQFALLVRDCQPAGFGPIEVTDGDGSYGMRLRPDTTVEDIVTMLETGASPEADDGD